MEPAGDHPGGADEKRAVFMGILIAIASRKGGVGKTTTAVNLAAALAIAEKSTLIVDCDPQAGATAWLRLAPGAWNRGLWSCMSGGATVSQSIADTGLPFLWALPAGDDLLQVETAAVHFQNREHPLKALLRNLGDEFDFVVMDTPPSLGVLTTNAIAAADFLLVPLQSEYLALDALGAFLRAVRTFKHQSNPSLRMAGILLSMVDQEDPLSGKIVHEVRRNLGDMVFQTVIPRTRELRACPTRGKPLPFLNASMGGRPYLNLASEVLDRSAPDLRSPPKEPSAGFETPSVDSYRKESFG